MKIRGDFVTNSSSVSFVLTIKEEIIDINIGMHGKDSTFGKFYSWIKEKLKDEGKKVDINGEEMYSLKVKFRDDDWRYEIPETEDIVEFYDFLENKGIDNMDDEELFCYLHYAILNPSFIPNIGATRTKTY